MEKMLSAYAYHRLITDFNNRPIDYEFIEINPAYELMTGLKQEDIVGRRIMEIEPGIVKDTVNWLEFYGNVALSGQSAVIEHYFKPLNQWFLVHANSPKEGYFASHFIDVTTLKQRESVLVKKNNFLVKAYEKTADSEKKIRKQLEEIQHDITILKQNEQKMMALAYRDSLTNLPNKNLFLDRLNKSISTGRRNGTKAAVVLVDLDDFNKINNSLGYSIGDKILVDAAKKLVCCMRDYDTVARVGEDKFLLLFQNLTNNNELFPIINRINAVLGESCNVDGHQLNIMASVGISVFPDDGDNPEDLLMNVDQAMYKAKELGKNCYYFFNDSLREEFKGKIKLKTMLNNAISNHEFVLYYQPRYEARTRRLRSFEALIRWNNPEVGLLMPVEFIPFAEETGLIVPIGSWVINTACQVCYKLNKVYGLNLNMSVNISSIQLKQKDFHEVISNAINNSGIEVSNLELEVPESVFKDLNKAVSVLKVLKDDGIRITLTDFGTGKLSISDLKKLPINMVKLDKEFIHEIDQTRPQDALAGSIISLVHKLNIGLIASGVENKEQLDYLIKGNCDNIQGYFFEEPVPEEMLGVIIKKGMLENEALTRVIQKAGLTYEGFVRQEMKRIGKKLDNKL